MKIIFLISFCMITTVYAQISKYVIASCIITSIDGKRDTVFNGQDGNISCTLDMTEKRIHFDWATKEYKYVKSYTVLREQVLKDKMYETMGVYSIKLKCLNKDKKECNIDFGINSRINNIDIVLVDGPFVLNYRAVQTQ